MRSRILIAAVALFFHPLGSGQAGATSSADSAAIHDLFGQHAKAVDTVDVRLLAQIWSHSPMSRSSIH